MHGLPAGKIVRCAKCVRHITSRSGGAHRMSNADVRRRFHIILVAGIRLKPTMERCVPISASLAAEIGHAGTDAY
jgi:hypothetical protein